MTQQIDRNEVTRQVQAREWLHTARVAGELGALLADGALLAVRPDDAALLARLERAGGVLDLVTGAVHWPGEGVTL